MSVLSKKAAAAKKRACKKVMAFHREHIGPVQGIRANPAAMAILNLLGVKHTRGRPVLAALVAISKHDGPLPKPENAKAPTTGDKSEFYASWEWTTLRMQALKANGGRCECCGSTAKDTGAGGQRVRIHVDHIKPLSKFWELRNDMANLQILCGECNKGKGAWDETDWRIMA